MAAEPTDAEVLAALQDALRETGSAPACRLRRRASEYQTSFPLERLEVELEDGSELQLAFKRLEWSGLDEEARFAKPRFLHDPRREPAVYGSLLEPAALGAPRYHGAAIDPERDRHWLFVEWVDGRELYQVGEPELWQAAAGWLARLHSEFGATVERHAEALPLLEHDAPFQRAWMRRAREFAQAPEGSPARARAVEWLAARHETVVEAVQALPRTLIHGEFYASNVLVAPDTVAARVAPVDWELAAVGAGLIDLAALVSGDWSEPRRAAIVAAYDAAGGSLDLLDFARLQLAIQWLGWAPAAWVPPAGQRHDWLAEAVALAEGLDL
jgi:hypothetical protein